MRPLRGAAVVLAAVAALLAVPGPAVAGAAPATECARAGAADVTRDQVVEQADLHCKNLTGLDLSESSLVQITLTGADAAGVSFRGAKMGQAELGGADLQGADLAHTDLTQATLTGADLRGADLTGADLTQADLSHADLTGADLDGARFTQTQTDGTNFTGVTGLIPWSLYVLVAAAVAFVVLAVVAVLRVRRSSRRRPSGARAAVAADAASTGRSPGVRLALALAGAFVAAFGVHMFLGGVVNAFSFGPDTLAAVCTAPQCSVGIDLGVFGVFGGVIVAAAGIAAIVRA